jgi:hypothetical protein
MQFRKMWEIVKAPVKTGMGYNSGGALLIFHVSGSRLPVLRMRNSECGLQNEKGKNKLPVTCCRLRERSEEKEMMIEEGNND